MRSKKENAKTMGLLSHRFLSELQSHSAGGTNAPTYAAL